jgi:hypothetical protein
VNSKRKSNVVSTQHAHHVILSLVAIDLSWKGMGATTGDRYLAKAGGRPRCGVMRRDPCSTISTKN